MAQVRIRGFLYKAPFHLAQSEARSSLHFNFRDVTRSTARECRANEISTGVLPTIPKLDSNYDLGVETD